ncbi:AlpA family transcriptional regulator [Snodgrassella sp. CFCC 13594]|uniref:helix-turn-helix transcriptional regulator n=1 Tax=Snodgrassella sp. CFCC 13594 TaxID=1775559 RepID=UPI00083362BC|nr:AlpA family phage regulatory protein [Snodgrassella sp. CFCC 13594]
MSLDVNSKFERPLWPTEVIQSYFDWASKSPLYRAMHNDAFPKPLRIGGRSLWRREEVLAWVDTREQGLDNKPQFMKKGAVA